LEKSNEIIAIIKRKKKCLKIIVYLEKEKRKRIQLKESYTKDIYKYEKYF